MKYIFTSLFVFSALFSCSAEGTGGDCGTKVVSGVTKQLNLGSEGGCYYINDSGNKSYVDRSECRCD